MRAVWKIATVCGSAISGEVAFVAHAHCAVKLHKQMAKQFVGVSGTWPQNQFAINGIDGWPCSPQPENSICWWAGKARHTRLVLFLVLFIRRYLSDTSKRFCQC